MTEMIPSFPQELWCQIFHSADYFTVCSVRASSKQFKDIVDDSHVWKLWYTERWGKFDSRERKSLYYVFRERALIDKDVVDSVKQIATTDVENMTVECSRLLDYGNIIIPVLVSQKSQLELDFETRSEMLSEYYLFSSMLQTLRRKQGFDYLKTKKAANSHLEEHFYELAHFDPSFDRLEKFRNKSLTELRKETAKYHEQNSEKYFETALFCLSTFRDIQLRNAKKAGFYHHHFYEDKFLLRVYSGEAGGEMLILRSIACRVLNEIGIDYVNCHWGLFLRKTDGERLGVMIDENNIYKLVEKNFEQCEKEIGSKAFAKYTSSLTAEAAVDLFFDSAHVSHFFSSTLLHSKGNISEEYMTFIEDFCETTNQRADSLSVSPFNWDLENSLTNLWRKVHLVGLNDCNAGYHGEFVQGDLVRKGRKYGVVLGEKMVEYDQDSLFYSVLLFCDGGMPHLVRSGSLEKCALSEEEIKNLTLESNLGLFFSRWRDGRFVESVFLKNH